VEVRTAPWVEVNRVEVFVDGALAARRRVSRHPSNALTPPLRWHTTLTAPERDAAIVVVVRGDTELTRAGVPTKPFAFTNPIYVDVDGDGAWSRGLPQPADAGSAAPGDAGAPGAPAR
jgi:hypothetical protein